MKKNINELSFQSRVSLFLERLPEVLMIQDYLDQGAVLTVREKDLLDAMYRTSSQLAEKLADNEELRKTLLDFRSTYWRLIDNSIGNRNRHEDGEVIFYA